MKVLVAGDMHGNLHFSKEVVDLACETGAITVLQVGDFGLWTHQAKGVAFLDELNTYLIERGQALYWVDGNHENFDHLEKYEITPTGWRPIRSNIINIPRGKRWEWDGVTFIAMGGANSIDGPKGAAWWHQSRGPVLTRQGTVDLLNWWPQEEITENDVEAVSNEHADILVSHDCPYGINIPTIDRTYPEGTRQRQLLRQVVDKVTPDMVFHGHYHTPHEGLLDNGLTYVVGLSHDRDDIHKSTFLLDLETL